MAKRDWRETARRFEVVVPIAILVAIAVWLNFRIANTIADYAYVGLRRKKIEFQNGTTQTNSYTGFRSELETIHHETSVPATILQLDYGYNKVHDRTYERFGGSGASGDAFEYDKLRRLTKVWQGSSNPSSPSGNSYVRTIEYNYDDDGNRSSVVTTPSGGSASTVSYSTNNLNQYTSVGGTSQTHDANGNLTHNGTVKLAYNYKNLIVTVRDQGTNALIATYKYDPLGRRVEKDVGGTIERYFLCTREAEDDLGNLANVMCTYDGSANWKQSFVHHGEVDDLAMLEQADVLDYDSDGNTAERTRSFYHLNALGSVMEITDMNEAKVASYRYDPYGKVTITVGGTPQSSDPLGQHWGFTGRFHDAESGLLYYRARFYDDDTGRFLQRDPLGYAAGPGLYEYTSSNPTNFTDPSGLEDRIPFTAELPRGQGGYSDEEIQEIEDAINEAIQEDEEVREAYEDAEEAREDLTETNEEIEETENEISDLELDRLAVATAGVGAGYATKKAKTPIGKAIGGLTIFVCGAQIVRINERLAEKRKKLNELHDQRREEERELNEEVAEFEEALASTMQEAGQAAAADINRRNR